METINSTIHGSQANGTGPSSQQESGGTPGTQGMDLQIPAGLQQHRSIQLTFQAKTQLDINPLVFDNC
ncbi:UNVERIFIED_CONTAM: hypothetical protein Sangu_1562500 [Sesamum angustifolium]|uniref:Uncharacterized protein n=1 Tax=Sesamum angustifolium TaxID=2727405 RepID=A0AAW2MTK9_9LAMI